MAKVGNVNVKSLEHWVNCLKSQLRALSKGFAEN